MSDDVASSSDASPPIDQATANALNVAKVAKAQAEARSAAASADTAEAGARTAAAKALIGEIPSAPYTGAVTTTEAAALAEHNLLARQALAEVAVEIAKDAEACIGGNVFVTSDDIGPSRVAAENFKLNSELVRQALQRSIDLSKKLEGSGSPADDGASDDFGALTVVPLVLSGLNALLSYARSDHSLSGRELQPGDRTLVTAVAHELLKHKKRLRLDGPAAAASEDEIKNLIDELAKLSSSASDARALAAHHAAKIEELSPKAAPTGAPGTADQDQSGSANPDPTHRRPLHEQALGSLNAAVKLYDELETSLLAVSEGRSGIARVAAARTLAAFLEAERSALLVVKLDGVFGSTLSSKNLFTTISGEIPYKLSVQLQVNWRCFDAKTFELLGGGLKSKYIPFKEVDEMADL